MTSPTQLKYLDAMGIPVWVSRDLVFFDKIIETNSDEEILGSRSDTTTIRNNNLNKENDSARSILDSLDQDSKVSRSSINDGGQDRLDKVISNSVVKAQISQNTIPDSEHDDDSSTESIPRNILFKTSQHYVFANGNESADWMVIGHSPEIYNGIGEEPFAGDAGELLNNMMIAVGFDKPSNQTYRVNVVDVNQLSDQSPNQNDTKELQQKLTSIISKVKPKLVLLVGQIAAQNLLQREDPLIVLRSKAYTLTDNNIPCVVTYYPSYLLEKPIDKRKAWNDLKLAMSLLKDVG